MRKHSVLAQNNQVRLSFVPKMSLRRAAVFFKSISHTGIFIVKSDVINLPGGEVEDGETVATTAVREVIEELGGWPPGVSRCLDEVPFIDCGSTTYFILILDESKFQYAYWYLLNLFVTRADKEKRKIS